MEVLELTCSGVASNQSFRRSVHPDDIPFHRFKCPLPLLQKMNSLFQWLAIRQGREPNEEPLMTETDWCFSRLCDASSGNRQWSDAALQLCEVVDDFRQCDLQLILDVLEQQPTISNSSFFQRIQRLTDQMNSLLRVLRLAFERHLPFHALITQPEAIRTIRWILFRGDVISHHHVKGILETLWLNRKDVDLTVLMPPLLDCLRTEDEHPFARAALGIIQQWLSSPLFSIETNNQETMEALCIYWSLHPRDLGILSAVFSMLDALYKKGCIVHQCYYLAGSIFEDCFRSNEENTSRVLTQKWFSAGVLAILAVHNRSLLREFVLTFLPRILLMEWPRTAIIGNLIRKSSADVCCNRITYALLKASKVIPAHLRQLINELHKMRTSRSTWISQSSLRDILENLGEMAQITISIVDSTLEQLKLILKEHGIRQECVERLNMNGEEFLACSVGQLAHLINLTTDEILIVTNIKSAHNYMVEISGNSNPRMISKQEMEWFLQPLRSSEHRLYVSLIESHASLDENFYLHRLVRIVSCLDFVTGRNQSQ
eukprot:g5878.t1